MLKFPERRPVESPILYIEDTDAPLAGLSTGTRYAYFKVIARGGKSIIQSCKDLRLSRVVCYKALKPELSDDPLERQRFLREARVTAMLVHPNTVPVYDLGEDRHGRLYFTMKLVHGYTFREILDFRERYDLSQLVGVLLQVAQALAYAHTHGVTHRDIKPENILVGPFGEVLLLDWGLAKVRARVSQKAQPVPPEAGIGNRRHRGTLTDHGKLQGTPSYMSPEQVRRDPDIGPRSDIFSMGTILYEVLTGHLPARGDTINEILESIQTDDVMAPSKLSTFEVPDLLEKVCLWCLNKDEGSRLPSASQLVRELSEDWMRSSKGKT